MHERQRIVQLVVALLVAVAAGPALASVTIDIGAATAPGSGSAKVPITMRGATGGAGGVQIDIQYSTAVLGVADSTHACALAPGVPGTVSSSLIGGAPPGKARLRMLLFDFAGRTYTDRLLVNCTFTVAANAAIGASVLDGLNLTVADPKGKVLASTVDPGAVTVTCTGCCP